MRVFLAALAVLIVAAPASAAGVDRLADVHSFALALGDGAAQRNLDGYDLIVVDGDTPARRVKALRAGGAVVLGYLSVGTIESYRSWFGAAKPYRLELWDDWGEWYADVSRPGFRDLIARRAAPRVLARGFDGLFLDNVDMIVEHRKQAAGMLALVKRLARMPGFLFAQNGDEIIDRFLPYLDGWNREDVSRTYDFDSKRYRAVPAADSAAAQATLQRLARRLPVVSATDYVAAGDDAAAARATKIACDIGALSYVSDIELRRVPQPPPTC
ncbi:MAG: endo alpha-1,4 polygalactosaminidase [Solirubrobacteraceae bacterium]